MSSVVISGDTSGSITLAAPAVAGTNTVTIPATTGTMITTGSPQSGSVLQVVNATTIANISTTSTSFVTTGFSVSITPKFSTSKILVFVNGGAGYVYTSALSMWCTIYRNSTNIGDATYGLERFYGGSSAILSPHSMCVLDSPATTSSTTYTCYFKTSGGSTVDFSYSDRGIVSFTAMEIAA
jgi:hypothetical protein